MVGSAMQTSDHDDVGFVQTCASVSVRNFEHFLWEYDTLMGPEIKALHYAQM